MNRRSRNALGALHLPGGELTPPLSLWEREQTQPAARSAE